MYVRVSGGERERDREGEGGWGTVIYGGGVEERGGNNNMMYVCGDWLSLSMEIMICLVRDKEFYIFILQLLFSFSDFHLPHTLK